jgi:hypothetical protein
MAEPGDRLDCDCEPAEFVVTVTLADHLGSIRAVRQAAYSVRRHHHHHRGGQHCHHDHDWPWLPPLLDWL